MSSFFSSYEEQARSYRISCDKNVIGWQICNMTCVYFGSCEFRIAALFCGLQCLKNYIITGTLSIPARYVKCPQAFVCLAVFGQYLKLDHYDKNSLLIN